MRRLLAPALLGLWGVLIFGSALRAEVPLTPEQQAIGRLELASGQRHRGQLIAKGTCFAMSRYNAKANAAAVWLMVDEYNQATRTLQRGSDLAGFGPETNEVLVQLLADNQGDWQVYSTAARQIVSGDRHSVPLLQILTLNEAVLAAADAFATKLRLVYMPQMRARHAMLSTMNMAGRQRMLIQRAAKEFCFIALDIDAEQMRASLQESVAEFESALLMLERGDYDRGIVDPPSLKVLGKIATLKEQWEVFRRPLQRAIDGAVLSDADIRQIEEQNTPLFQTANELVQMYRR